MRTCNALILLCLAFGATRAQTPNASWRAARQTLVSADSAASAASAWGSYATAISDRLADDATFLLDGAPVVHGRDDVRALLAAQPALAQLRTSWQPLRTLLSRDENFGVTFGVLARPASSTQGEVEFGRYATAWRRDGSGSWRIVAHVLSGLASATSQPAGDRTGLGSRSELRDDFSAADLAFSRMANDSGAPAAFANFAAPVAIMYGSQGELTLGPRGIRTRMASGPLAAAKWKWWPVVSAGSASRDLGVTLGEAVIALGADTLHSKYFTTWERQPDGSLRFVNDLGNGRP